MNKEEKITWFQIFNYVGNTRSLDTLYEPAKWLK